MHQVPFRQPLGTPNYAAVRPGQKDLFCEWYIHAMTVRLQDERRHGTPNNEAEQRNARNRSADSANFSAPARIRMCPLASQMPACHWLSSKARHARACSCPIRSQNERRRSSQEHNRSAGI